MNLHSIPTHSEAIKHLAELLHQATFFDLHYLSKSFNDRATLDQLHELVSSYYQQAPHPDTLNFTPSYFYEAYYQCLDNLYHNPLIRIDYGNQSLVNLGYITVIQTAQQHLSISQ